MAINDLNQMFSIVDPSTGKPTEYLMRLLRDRGVSAENVEELVAKLDTDVQALDAIVDIINGTDIVAGVGLAGGGEIGTNNPITLDLENTSVIPGSYTNTDLTIDAQGRITAAANGTGGGGGGGGSSTLFTWDGAIDPVFATSAAIPLDGIHMLQVIFTDVTMATAGWRVAEFSFDGGTTWENGGPDNYLASSPAAGTVGAAGTGTDSSWFLHSTSSALARSAVGVMWGLNVDGIKSFRSNRNSDGTHLNRSKPTHVRVRGWLTTTTQANFTGGRISVVGYTKAGGGGGGSSPWEVISTTVIGSPVASVTATDLDDYTDLMIIASGVTTSTSDFRVVELSTNNGVSYFAGSSDYVIVANSGATSANVAALATSASSSASRTFGGIIHGSNVNGSTKICQNISGQDTRIFVANTLPINAVRVRNLTGNLTGGTIYILGRPATGGGSGGLTPPVSGDFPTTLGSPTIAYESKSALISGIANGSGLSGIAKTTSGAVTLTGKIGVSNLRNFNGGGLFMSDGTKYLVLGHFFQEFVLVSQWNTRTSFSSEPVDIISSSRFPEWLRMVFNGTNVSLQISYTGDNWLTIQSGNTWLSTVTSVGFVINRNNVSAGPAMWVESFSIV